MSVLLCLLMMACPEQATPVVRQFCDKHCLPAQALGCDKKDRTCHKSLILHFDQIVTDLNEAADETPECRRQNKRLALTALSESLAWHRDCALCQDAEGNQPFGTVTLAARLLKAAAVGYQAGQVSDTRLVHQLRQVAGLLQEAPTPAMAEYATQVKAFMQCVQSDLKGNG